MGFSYEIPVEVVNPQTQDVECWELEVRVGGSGGHRQRSVTYFGDLEFNVVRRGDGEQMDFKDFCTLYRIDGSQVDAWYALAENHYDDAREEHEEARAEAMHDED